METRRAQVPTTVQSSAAISSEVDGGALQRLVAIIANLLEMKSRILSGVARYVHPGPQDDLADISCHTRLGTSAWRSRCW